MPDTPRKFKVKANAQDGHEAIRPTMPNLSPDQVKDSLTSDQYKLYKLIWERFIACQMSNCLQSTTQADIQAKIIFSKLPVIQLHLTVIPYYMKKVKTKRKKQKAHCLFWKNGMPLKCKELVGNQHFTQPPPRYTEASLIKALEENGIGRPSTYATTISTITSREYVTRKIKH